METYRTDSAARRLLCAAIPALAQLAHERDMTLWFELVGSVANNTASTIKVGVDMNIFKHFLLMLHGTIISVA